MDPKMKKFIKKLESISLTADEKNNLRQKLIKMTEEKPAVVSPYQSISSIWNYFCQQREMQLTIVAIIFIIGFGSTMTLAAESSLPGQILYPIKVRVNEPIERLVSAFSPELKAEFEAKIFEKRLVEAEVLAKIEDLPGDKKEKVKAEIVKQTARAERAAKDFGMSISQTGTNTDTEPNQAESGTLPVNATTAGNTDTATQTLTVEVVEPTALTNLNRVEIKQTEDKSSDEDEKAKPDKEKQDKLTGKDKKAQKTMERLEKIKQKHNNIINDLGISDDR